MIMQALGSCALLMYSFGHRVYELGLVSWRMSDDCVCITELVQGGMKRPCFMPDFYI